MSKLTKDELTEMKAVGYIEGNSATIPSPIKIGDELHEKLVAHDEAFTKKHAKQANDDDREQVEERGVKAEAAPKPAATSQTQTASKPSKAE